MGCTTTSNFEKGKRPCIAIEKETGFDNRDLIEFYQNVVETITGKKPTFESIKTRFIDSITKIAKSNEKSVNDVLPSKFVNTLLTAEQVNKILEKYSAHNKWSNQTENPKLYAVFNTICKDATVKELAQYKPITLLLLFLTLCNNDILYKLGVLYRIAESMPGSTESTVKLVELEKLVDICYEISAYYIPSIAINKTSVDAELNEVMESYKINSKMLIKKLTTGMPEDITLAQLLNSNDITGLVINSSDIREKFMDILHSSSSMLPHKYISKERSPQMDSPKKELPKQGDPSLDLPIAQQFIKKEEQPKEEIKENDAAS